MIGTVEYRGELYVWRLVDGLVTVFAPDNYHQCTQLGGSSPHSIAWILAKELAHKKREN